MKQFIKKNIKHLMIQMNQMKKIMNQMMIQHLMMKKINI